MAAMTAAQLVTLDRRRGWARIRAIVAWLLGVLIFALSAAGLVMIILAGFARAWSWFTDESITDAPVRSWAPGGAGWSRHSPVYVSFVGAFWYFWRGAGAQVLDETRAVPLNPQAYP